jgi:hypothetical protein
MLYEVVDLYYQYVPNSTQTCFGVWLPSLYIDSPLGIHMLIVPTVHFNCLNIPGIIVMRPLLLEIWPCIFSFRFETSRCGVRR